MVQETPQQERKIVRTATTETQLYQLGTSDGTDTSGVFMFPANDPRLLDQHGQIDAHKLFLTDHKTGQELTAPKDIEKQMTEGYVSHWDELTDQTRRTPTHTILATSSPDKLIETRSSMKHYDQKLKLVNQFLGFTPEDSKEEQANGADIVLDKINRSIVDEMAELSKSQIKVIKATLGVSNFDTTVTLSNDISLMFDPQLKDSPVWDFLRTSEDPLIKEIFDANHDFPGKRTREITKACGGAPNFYRLIKQATEERKSQGIDINPLMSSGTWLHARPLTSGTTNLPDEGIVIYQQLNNMTLAGMSDAELQYIEDNHLPFAMDEVEIPKSRKNKKTPDGKPMTIASAREHDVDYFSEGDYPLGNMLHTLLGEDFLNVARLPEPQNWDFTARADKSNILVVGGSVSHVRKVKKELQKHTPDKPVKITHLKSFDAIQSCAELEKLANKSDAIVIPDQNYEGMDSKDALAWKSTREFVYAYRLALEGKGSNAMSGCPVFTTPNALEEIKYHGTFFNLGSSATKVDNVLNLYDGTAASLSRVLSDTNWDPEGYKPKDTRTHFPYEMMTEEELSTTIGVDSLDDLGLTVAVLGGATTEELGALKETEDMAYEAAKSGVTLTHGGGTAGVMGAIIKGGIRAYLDGYRGFKQIGIRTPIVSAAEGSIKKFLRELVKDINDQQGTDLTIDDLVSDGDVNSQYYSLFEDHFHILEKDAFGVRQDGVLRFVNEAIVMPGGHGTAYEDVHMNLDAALIAARGTGVFQPSTQSIAKHIVNIPDAVDPSKGFWDSYIASKTLQEQALLNQTIQSNAMDALKDIRHNAAANGIQTRQTWNINDPQPTQDLTLDI